MVNLSARAREMFRDRMSRLSDADLHNHPKVVAFKNGIQNSFSRGERLDAPEILGRGDVLEAHWICVFSQPKRSREQGRRG